MKKLFALILSLVIIFGLCSCGNNINSITLATNSCEIVQDKTFKLSYTVIPENASVDGLIWASADENIATIDTNGTITALSVGQTSITISDGKKVFATCSVTVLEKPAYERLNEDEKAFVDTFLSRINEFKNPDSVEITGVHFVPGNGIEDFWSIEVKAQNSFGAINTSVYFLQQNQGFTESPFPFEWSDPTYRLDLINKAIDEKR